MFRSLLLATALLAATAVRLRPQEPRRRASRRRCCAPASPSPATWCGSATSSTTRATAAQIAIYRAPDLGTTGSLPTAQVISALRAHQVIGVDTKDLREISVTRLARTLDAKDIELPGRARARAPQRPWRCRQSQPDLRPRRAGHAAGGLQHRRDAAGVLALRRRTAAASMSPSRSATMPARPRPNCALPAARSKPWKPRSWRATSSATRS